VKLKELEKRLATEPDNLGLRVQVAGLMREAGRSVEAVELYRSVALAYRDQGRIQQAIAVCRSVLDIAPDDAACQGLLSSLQAPSASEPFRRVSRNSIDETPLPRPIPHHVADPTSQRYKVSERDLQLPLPPAEVTPPPPRLSAASGIPTSQIDAAAEVETRQRVKIRTDQLEKLDDVTVPGEPSTDRQQRVSSPSGQRITPLPRDSPATRLTPTIPIAHDSESDDMLTQPRDALAPRTSDEEMTRPHPRGRLFDDED
jgi:hypothetical protein